MRALVFLFAILATVECCDFSDECGPEEFCDGQESYYYPYSAECQSWLGWLQLIWSLFFAQTFIYACPLSASACVHVRFQKLSKTAIHPSLVRLILKMIAKTNTGITTWSMNVKAIVKVNFTKKPLLFDHHQKLMFILIFSRWRTWTCCYSIANWT